MAQHGSADALTVQANIPVYFAHPRSPWEADANAPYFPNGTNNIGVTFLAFGPSPLS